MVGMVCAGGGKLIHCLFSSSIIRKFLTHDIEYRTAMNSGMGKCSSFMGDASMKTVKLESRRQLLLALLNSVNQSQTWQCHCIETWHMKAL